MNLKSYFNLFMLTMSIHASSCNAQNDAVHINGGKKIFVDGNDIRTAAGGTRVLYLDGNTLRTTPGGERLLFIDGDNVRPEPSGSRLAFWDGNTLRRKPAGAILVKIDGNTIRNAKDEKLITVDNLNSFSKNQLTAALYYLNPNIFKPDAAEMADIQADAAEGQAWDAEQASSDHENGTYFLIHSLDDYKNAGDCTIKWQNGKYVLNIASTQQQGIAVKRDDFGYRLTGAFGKGNTTIGVFKHNGQAYSGTWYNTSNPATKNENYTTEFQQVTKNAFNSALVGKLTFADSEKKVEYEGKVYEVSNTEGKAGLAYEVGNPSSGYCLVIVLGADVALYNLKVEGDMISGEITGNKAKGFVLYQKK